MKTESKKTILLAGHYGFGNTGDEAILSAILSSLRTQQSGIEFIVSSFNPQATSAAYHVRSVHWKDIQGLLEAARQSDLIMIGGGGVFVDYWGVPANTQLTEHHWGISYYNAIALLAALFNKPFMIHSVGVGPLLTDEGKCLTRQTFEFADVATVRDEASRDLLISIGVPAHIIRVTSDPALGLVPKQDSAFEIFQRAGISFEEQPVLGVCIRNWADASKGGNWKHELAAGLDQFFETHEAKAIFIPFQKEEHQLEDDVVMAEDVRSLMRHRDKTHVLSEIHPPEIVKGLLSRCHAVLGMRLHSLIFAAGAGVPVVALAYDPKVTGFMESLGLSVSTIDLQKVTAGNLCQMIDQIWANPDPVRKKLSKQVTVLKKRLQTNNSLIVRLLNGKPLRVNKAAEEDILREFAITQTISLMKIEKKFQSSLEQKLKRMANARPLYLINRMRKVRDYFRQSDGSGGRLNKKLIQRAGRMLFRIRDAVRRYGLWRAVTRTIEILIAEFPRTARKIIFRAAYLRKMKALDEIISNHNSFIDFFPAPMGWSTIWFQRFQHFSLQAAKLGGVALYGGFPPMIDRDLFIYREVTKNLFVFDAMDWWVRRRVFQALENTTQPRVMRIQSVDLGTTLDDIHEAVQNGFKVIYEYIDEFSSDITGPVPEMIQQRHEALLKNEDVFVVATSDQLYKNVTSYRTRNFILSVNGVDVEHWRAPKGSPPEDLKPVLDGKIIVAYHGTLASWVDYDLLHMIADDGRYNLLLIGHQHDDAFTQSGLKTHPRVFYLGGKSYFELNTYAAYYDITILPFRKTQMTEAVSPVKIFEYMAARKPVVTTDLHECKKYKSCLVAGSNSEFIQLLHRAEELVDNPPYLALLEKEANENSWENKTREVLKMVGINV